MQKETAQQTKLTAYWFLRLMSEMATILLQDAAAMMVQSEGRHSHPIFQLDVFQSNQFKVNEIVIKVGELSSMSISKIFFTL